MSRTALYRHYDAAGSLIYAGITFDIPRRWEQHKCGSSWAYAVAKTTAEYFDTREEAVAAEIEAIRTENPTANKMQRRRGSGNAVEEGVFRLAFVSAFRASGASIVEVSAATGVSRDTINKLLARDGSSTSVERAMALASFFGHSVESLIATQQARLAEAAA